MTIRKNNSLSARQKIDLCICVKDVAASNHEIQSYKDAAALASKELGFQITYSNAEYAYSTMGIPCQRPQHRTSGNRASAHQKARSVTRAIISLCKALNHKPENYLELLKIAEQERWE